MAWRTQKEIIRDRDQDRRDRERREARDASAYWDGGGCECEDADDREDNGVKLNWTDCFDCQPQPHPPHGA